jgi:predicted RNase H-like HicB family nuclease
MADWKFQIIVTCEPDGFHSHCEELDLSSYGKTLEDAVSDLKEAIEFYLETASREEIERLRKKMNRPQNRGIEHHHRFEP